MPERFRHALPFSNPGFAHYAFNSLPSAGACKRPNSILFCWLIDREKKIQKENGVGTRQNFFVPAT